MYSASFSQGNWQFVLCAARRDTFQVALKPSAAMVCAAGRKRPWNDGCGHRGVGAERREREGFRAAELEVEGEGEILGL
jgi:hypothetical protein